MGKNSTHEITQLLAAWNQGKREALEALTLLLDQEQRQSASHYMAEEQPR